MKSITLKNISKRYGLGPGSHLAVDAVDLRIDEGELFFLLGPSGCGKTTLLRMIAGLIEPTDGVIYLGEQDVTNISVEKRNTAMVFQNYALWPHMTIYKNVEFGPKMRGVGAGERRRLAEENLHRVQMPGLGKRKPNQLSGGQQQRVALARALATGSDCLLLDEPLSNLDARLRMHMRGELRRLVKSSCATAVYVTHDQKEALSMADRIAVMQEGKIVQIGTPEEVYNRPANRFVADFIGEANFLPGRLVSGAPQATIETAVGRIEAEHVSDGAADAAEATCCVRPERIELIAADAPTPEGKAALPAEVLSGMYLGEIRQYTCRLEEETTWRVSMLGQQGRAFHEGDKVRLTFAPDDVCILAE
jgi:ABC-type Fe3+/spermidine/putrescine transport system ATPase subunit